MKKYTVAGPMHSGTNLCAGILEASFEKGKYIQKEYTRPWFREPLLTTTEESFEGKKYRIPWKHTVNFKLWEIFLNDNSEFTLVCLRRKLPYFITRIKQQSYDLTFDPRIPMIRSSVTFPDGTVFENLVDCWIYYQKMYQKLLTQFPNRVIILDYEKLNTTIQEGKEQVIKFFESHFKHENFDTTELWKAANTQWTAGRNPLDTQVKKKKSTPIVDEFSKLNLSTKDKNIILKKLENANLTSEEYTKSEKFENANLTSEKFTFIIVISVFFYLSFVIAGSIAYFRIPNIERTLPTIGYVLGFFIPPFMIWPMIKGF